MKHQGARGGARGRSARGLARALAAGLLLSGASCGQPGGSPPAEVRVTALAPLPEAVLYAYREGTDLRGPAYATSQASGEDGAISLALPPGKYFFILRKRVEGEAVGPVRTGDHRSEIVGPVTVRAGERITRDIVATVKVGETKTLPALSKIPAKTGIRGRVFDSDNRPVAGARVQAYTNPQMSERPKYVSEASGKDGSYALFFSEGATYYLAARDKFGGPPKVGELYGRYDDGAVEPSAVVVKDGEILEEIDIWVNRIF